MAGYPSPIFSVIARATSRSLTDLDAVKAELEIVGSASDALLTRYIAEESQTVETYCNRVFVKETVRDLFYPQRDPPVRVVPGGMDPLKLTRWPIDEIVSVVENGASLVEDVDFVVDVRSAALIRLDRHAYPRAWGALPIVVDYSAGYDQIPADVSAAVNYLVKGRWFAKKRDPNIKSEKVDGVYEASYWLGTGPGGPGDLPTFAADKLARYRVPVIA